MKRTAFAAVIGFVIWTAVWLTGNAGLGLVFSADQESFEAGGTLESVPYLAGALLLAAVSSFTAGYFCSRLGRARRRNALIWMVALLLIVGCAVQASVWNRMPLWYHAAFLLSIAPLCFFGARRGKT
jgi:hypothetical protein